MAGSSTQSMENFTPQGMERHQMMMNTEVMKHLRIRSRTSVREIMLQHEKTFKEQVHDLHKLYEVQRVLMDKAKSRGRDAYASVPPLSPGCGNLMSEETHQGQRSNFWGHAMPDDVGTVVKGGASSHMLGSPPKTVFDRIIKVEETPKCVSSPVRKRKIDLEQLPEDDSDDEMENSGNALNPMVSCVSRNSKELPMIYPGFDAPVKQGTGSLSVSSLQAPLPAIKTSQASSFLSGEIDVSRADNHPNTQPSLPLNVMKTEQDFRSFGERNMSFQNAGMLTTGVGTIKNSSVFLPQADLIDRASQETGRQAHWFLQASEPNIVDTSVSFPAQQQQRLSPHLALSEHSTSRSHPSTPHLEQRYPGNKSPWIESVGSSLSKVSLEKDSLGVPSGAQKDMSGTSTERLEDPSKWFLKESSSQGPPAKVVPMARFETGVMVEGGHVMPGIIAPAITITSNKGLSQERDVNLWSSKNPILQVPQYQQPPVFQQQIVPPASQSMWVQSSPNAQNSMYSQQQVVYGLHSSDPPQAGYRGELAQRNQGEIPGPWSMIGLGHYYSSIPATPHKPPFKKPPKLVLKNDGVGMELKLVSPEKEMSEKERAMQKKPLNVVKRDSLQALSKSCENNSGVHKQVGEEENKLNKRINQPANSTVEAKELEATLLATASSSSTLTISQGASTSVALSCVAQHNLGALPCPSGGETGLGFNVSASPNESILQQCASQLEMVLPSSESEKIAERRNSNIKTLRVASEKETLLLTNACTKDMQGQMEGGNFSKCEFDMNSGSGTVEERKESLDKMRTSERNAIDRVASSQSESLNMTPQGVQSKCLEDGGVATDMVRQRAQKLEDYKGSLAQQCADSESYQKGFSERNDSHNVDSACPADQLVMQAVCVQSTSTDTPSTSRQEKKRSYITSDNNLSQRFSGRISNACNNESGSPLSDGDCASAPSPINFMSEEKPEAIIGVLNEDLQHDSDSDNLAATILLSFAPKVDLPNEEKRSNDSTSEISSSIRKVKPADQGSRTFKNSEARIGSQSDYWNTAGSQGRRMQNSGGTSRVERMDHHDHSKVTVKDRHRREEMNHAERRTGEGDIVTKSLTIKLPRVASSTSNDGAIPISRSKQLSKLNGASLGRNPMEHIKNSHKGSETVHTPTGRRSSRGPPMGARTSLESRSRLHQQTQHRVECSPPPLDNEGVRSMNKLEGNMKSKAWGDLNRTRSHPRNQFPERSQRKNQK